MKGLKSRTPGCVRAAVDRCRRRRKHTSDLLVSWMCNQWVRIKFEAASGTDVGDPLGIWYVFNNLGRRGMLTGSSYTDQNYQRSRARAAYDRLPYDRLSHDRLPFSPTLLGCSARSMPELSWSLCRRQHLCGMSCRVLLSQTRCSTFHSPSEPHRGDQASSAPPWRCRPSHPIRDKGERVWSTVLEMIPYSYLLDERCERGVEVGSG